MSIPPGPHNAESVAGRWRRRKAERTARRAAEAKAWEGYEDPDPMLAWETEVIRSQCEAFFGHPITDDELFQ